MMRMGNPGIESHYNSPSIRASKILMASIIMAGIISSKEMTMESTNFFSFPQKELDFFAAPNSLESNFFNDEIFRRSGVLLIRNLISQECASAYLNLYNESLNDGSAEARKDHLTEVSFSPNSSLAKILFEPPVAALIANFFDGKPALHNIRIIRKDHINPNPVFVHQDTPYCLGFQDRLSLFVSLSKCVMTNGGLFAYPGTHNFGYLGDAGAIGESLTRQMFKFEPNLLPGDCLLMHSSTWHGSGANTEAIPRVLYDIQLQPVTDPSSILSLCHYPLSEWRLRLTNRDIFSSSRVQRASK